MVSATDFRGVFHRTINVVVATTYHSIVVMEV